MKTTRSQSIAHSFRLVGEAYVEGVMFDIQLGGNKERDFILI